MDMISLAKEFGTALLADVFSIKMLTKLLAKGAVAQNEGIGATKTAGPAEQIRFGGIFDLSDETAYFSLIAKMEADPNLKDAAVKMSNFINSSHFQHNDQRRRFRACVGNLSNIEYSNEDLIIEEEIPNAKGGKPTIKKTVKQAKNNLGIEFVKSFVRLTDDQKLGVCKASGVMESIIDNFFEDLDRVATKVMEKVEKIGDTDLAQKCMGGLMIIMWDRMVELDRRPDNNP